MTAAGAAAVGGAAAGGAGGATATALAGGGLNAIGKSAITGAISGAVGGAVGVYAGTTSSNAGTAFGAAMMGSAYGTASGMAWGALAYGEKPSLESFGMSMATAFEGAIASTALSSAAQAATERSTAGSAAETRVAGEKSTVSPRAVEASASFPSDFESELIAAYEADPSLPNQTDPVFSRRTEAGLATLRADLQSLAREHLFMLKQAGIDVDIAWEGASRDMADQARLFAKGRNGVPGPRVTNAKPGDSPHNYGAAYDISIRENGAVASGNSRTWTVAGRAGASIGLRWGGDFTGFVDRPHYELVNWRSASGLTPYARP